MPWRYQQYGTAADPVHKSHLNELTGEYGCPRRFRYQRDAELDLTPRDPAPAVTPRVTAAMACGSAAHETIARALVNAEVMDALLTTGIRPSTERIRATFEHELGQAADGRVIDWTGEDADQCITDRVVMIDGLLASLPKYVSRVVAVEPGFIVELDGVTYSGHVDCVFEPRDAPGELGIADWKTGKSKPDAIELAHGWEAGVYSAALLEGDFIAREAVTLTPHDDATAPGWCGSVQFETDGMPAYLGEVSPSRWQAERDALEQALIYWHKHRGRTAHPLHTRYGRYPARVYHVHLRDFVPYVKATTKVVKRPEDLQHYGLTHEQSVKCKAGDTRGPAWLPVALHENDVARLAYRARNVVGTVRMGRFVDLVREHCRRCPYSRDCLTGGYAPRGEALTALETELKKAGL